MHYDGNSWAEMNSGVSYSLSGVWGSSGDDVYAVGGNNTILHFNGSTWQEINHGLSGSFSGVWCASESNVFVVGYPGKILNYNGISWSEVDSPIRSSEIRVNAIKGYSGNDIYVVGNYGTILHYGESSNNYQNGSIVPILNILLLDNDIL